MPKRRHHRGNRASARRFGYRSENPSSTCSPPRTWSSRTPNRDAAPKERHGYGWARRRIKDALDCDSGLTLEFLAPDLDVFPLLKLAREAGERGGTYPCAFNAANEVSVQAFLEGRIRFLDIDGAVADVLSRVDGAPARDVEELVEADRIARELVAVA